MNTFRWTQAAGTAYAVGGALWFVLATTIASRFGSDPPARSDAFYLSEAVWISVQLLLLFGIFGVRWSGGIGRGIFGSLAFGIGVLGHLIFVAAEVHALLLGATSDLLAVAALVSALGLLLIGVAVIKAGRWQGWTRLVPFLVGSYFFLVMLPFIIIADEPNLYAVGGWGLLRLAFGLAIRAQGLNVPGSATPSVPLAQKSS